MSVERRNRKQRPWLARVRTAGESVSASFATEAEAKAWEAAARLAMKRGEPVPVAHEAQAPAGKPSVSMTVEDATRQWVKGAKAGAIRARGGMPYAMSSVEHYESLLRMHVVPALGGTRVRDLTSRDVEDYREHKALTVSDGVAKRSTTALALVLGWVAKRDPAMKGNPAHGLPPFSPPPPRVRYLSRNELGALMRAVEASEAERPAMAMGVRLMVATGARPAEIEGLPVRHCHEDRVVIAQQRNRYGKITTTKNGHTRSVPIPPEVGEALMRYVAGMDADALVVGRFERGHWLKLRDQVADDITMRALRHTAATMWLSGAPGVPGLSVHAVAKLLGHGGSRPDPTMVLRTYGHVIPEDTDRAPAIMGAAMSHNQGAQGGGLGVSPVYPPNPQAPPTFSHGYGR